MKDVRKTQWFRSRAATVLLLMLCAAGIRAQVPGDATWQETMAFIGRHEGSLTAARVKSDRVLVGSGQIYKSRHYALDRKHCVYVYEASLKTLKAVEKEYDGANELKGMKLIFSAKAVLRQKYCDYRSDDVHSKMTAADVEELEDYLSIPYGDYHGARVISRSSSLEFPVGNARAGERLAKAFEHLIDLAGEAD